MEAKTLKQMREKKKLTQEQASKVLNITKEYLSMLERGERNPSDKIKKRMALLYDSKIGDIFLACEETKCFKNEIKEAR